MEVVLAEGVDGDVGWMQCSEVGSEVVVVWVLVVAVVLRVVK